MRNALVGVVMLCGCPGKAPPDPNNLDAAVADASTTDAAGATTAVVSGKVVDYFTGDPLAATAITTDGIDPPQAITSDATGAYSIDVGIGSKVFVTTTRTSYHTARSEFITVADQPVMQTIYAVSAMDIARQFNSEGVPANAGTILIVDVQKDNGDPFPGLLAAAFTLTDVNGVAAPNAVGPFFFGALGDLDQGVTMSTASTFGGAMRTRVAFLNASPGSYTVTTTFNDGAARTYKTPLVLDAGGATMVLSGGANSALTAISPITDPSFATDIYPRLQKASKGGLGCGNCHTANGPAALLPYDNADPAVTLAAIKAAPGVIVAATPATSLFLTNPLYETTPPQNHPNATFLDVNDPSYKLFLLWITNGTKP
jgi:hypothetical protein